MFKFSIVKYFLDIRSDYIGMSSDKWYVKYHRRKLKVFYLKLILITVNRFLKILKLKLYLMENINAN